MDKKNNSNIIIIVVIIIALIVLIVLKNISKKVTPAPVDQNTIELQAAVKSDKTTDITTNLNEIKVEDTTDAELNAVDQELKNL